MTQFSFHPQGQPKIPFFRGGHFSPFGEKQEIKSNCLDQEKKFNFFFFLFFPFWILCVLNQPKSREQLPPPWLSPLRNSMEIETRTENKEQRTKKEQAWSMSFIECVPKANKNKRKFALFCPQLVLCTKKGNKEFTIIYITKRVQCFRSSTKRQSQQNQL